jgi:hypothetical protein
LHNMRPAALHICIAAGRLAYNCRLDYHWRRGGEP